MVAEDQIRTVIQTFRDKVTTEIFPGREHVPKTIIFAKDDSHADDIVNIVREEFGKGNDFCRKITYRTTGAKPEDLITQFRNSFNPRIVVTVDMIATGTDIKPVEVVFFMRNVRSRNFFEQMKGRGVRTISQTEFNSVTPDATDKDRFVIVDAVGVTESELGESYSLDRQPVGVPSTSCWTWWPWATESRTRCRRWPAASPGWTGGSRPRTGRRWSRWPTVPR